MRLAEPVEPRMLKANGRCPVRGCPEACFRMRRNSPSTAVFRFAKRFLATILNHVRRIATGTI
jgi:hypothetical protein